MVSWLLASSHPVPTETQPREWRMCPIGRTDGGGECSSVVVVDVVSRLCPLQRTGAAAERRTDGLDKEVKKEVRS